MSADRRPAADPPPLARPARRYAAQLEAGATAISCLFIIEMGLKLVGLGCHGYWSDGWNQLDGSIVSISIVEMALTALLAGSGVQLSFLRILRMLRVARMLRLMRSWEGLYKIITTVGRALPQMSNVFILLFLINTIFALLGMQLFGGHFTEAHGYGPPPLQPVPRCDLGLPRPTWPTSAYLGLPRPRLSLPRPTSAYIDLPRPTSSPPAIRTRTAFPALFTHPSMHAAPFTHPRCPPAPLTQV